VIEDLILWRAVNQTMPALDSGARRNEINCSERRTGLFEGLSNPMEEQLEGSQPVTEIVREQFTARRFCR
jgi:hypothetical protein